MKMNEVGQFSLNLFIISFDARSRCSEVFFFNEDDQGAKFTKNQRARHQMMLNLD